MFIPSQDYMIHYTEVTGLGTTKNSHSPIVCDLDRGVQLTPLSPKVVHCFRDGENSASHIHGVALSVSYAIILLCGAFCSHSHSMLER